MGMHGDSVTMSKQIFDSNTQFLSLVKSFGILMFFAITGKLNILDCNPNSFYLFWDDLNQTYSLPDSLFELNKNCYEDVFEDFTTVIDCITTVQNQLNKYEITKQNFIIRTFDNKPIIDACAKGILDSIDKIKSFKYPNVPFILNDYNFSNGRLGIEYALKKVTETDICIWDDIKDLILSETRPLLGLYNGISGCIWVLLDSKEFESAMYLAETYLENIDWEDYNNSLFSGLAGIGLTYLKIYSETNDVKWIKLAKKAEKVISNQLQKKSQKFGLKNGNTGTSFFI